MHCCHQNAKSGCQWLRLGPRSQHPTCFGRIFREYPRFLVDLLVVEPLDSRALLVLQPRVGFDEGDDPIRTANVIIQNQSNKSWCHFVFQKALLVSELECSLQLKSSVVLYNLALIHHMLGIHECASKKSTAAMRLYLLALDLVKKHSQEYGSKQTLLVSLAIANNLGDIYLQQFHDAEEAKKCFALVRETLKHLDHLETDTLGGSNELEYFIFFYLNAMVRGNGDIVTATAA